MWQIGDRARDRQVPPGTHCQRRSEEGRRNLLAGLAQRPSRLEDHPRPHQLSVWVPRARSAYRKLGWHYSVAVSCPCSDAVSQVEDEIKGCVLVSKPAEELSGS